MSSLVHVDPDEAEPVLVHAQVPQPFVGRHERGHLVEPGRLGERALHRVAVKRTPIISGPEKTRNGGACGAPPAVVIAREERRRARHRGRACLALVSATESEHSLSAMGKFKVGVRSQRRTSFLLPRTGNARCRQMLWNARWTEKEAVQA